jgi:CDP-diacylglycerol--glycerol-3-phosphate 3-phosphatidyltransferase
MISKKAIPNTITVSRIALSIIFLLLAQIGLSICAFIILIVAIASDFLDGYLARKLDAVTTAGKMLDPFADKLIIIFGFIITYLHNIIPKWFVLFVAIKELIIIIGAIILLSKNKVEFVKPSIFGKLAMLVQSTYLIYLSFNIFILKSHPNKVLNEIILIVSIIFAAASFISYYNMFFKCFKKK